MELQCDCGGGKSDDRTWALQFHGDPDANGAVCRGISAAYVELCMDQYESIQLLHEFVTDVLGGVLCAYFR